MADAQIGAIVRVDGRWGVVCGSDRGITRVVDFWDGGREYVARWMIAELAA